MSPAQGEAAECLVKLADTVRALHYGSRNRGYQPSPRPICLEKLNDL
jgi:hypothetical protein